MLIIGAGVAGSVAALHLARAGFDVVCLEQGAGPTASEFPGSKPEWELLASRQWHPNPNVRGRPADYPCETSDSDVNPLMWSGVGGSTILYSAHWVRFLPSDFRVRSLDGIADDWPFTYDDLVPYYERVEHEFAVSGAGRRSGLSRRARGRRCRRCRSARSAGGRPPGWTSSAGTGGRGRTRSPRARTGTCARAACAAPA